MCSLSERHWGGKSYQMKAWFKGNLIHSNTQQLKGVGVPGCVQLCDSRDRSPPSTSVHGTLQARILDWAAISSSRGSSWPRDWTQVSRVSCIGRQIFFFFIAETPGKPTITEFHLQTKGLSKQNQSPLEGCAPAGVTVMWLTGPDSIHGRRWWNKWDYET